METTAAAADDQQQGKSIGKLVVYLNKPLGEGSYGKVFQGLFENKVKVAVKRIDKSKVTFDEQDILIKVDTHEHIVRYYCTEIDRFDEIEYA
jgi:serine/threonine protein kinase